MQADKLRKYFVYGSCVARDTLEAVSARVVRYVARQSLISIENTVRCLEERMPAFESPFRQRQGLADAEGDAWRQIARYGGEAERIVFDLVDERGGVYRCPHGGYITRSSDRLMAGSDDALADWPVIHFGGDEHFGLWVQAFDALADRLRGAGLWDRSTMLAVPWASRSVQGDPSPLSVGLGWAEANVLYDRYYAHVAAAGLTVLRPRAEPLADRDHRWGLAAFHYHDAVYADVAEQLALPSGEKPKDSG